MSVTTPPPDLATEPVLDDFVFGGIEADDDRILAMQRRRLSGLRHRYELSPRDPRPGDEVRITVYCGPDVNVDRISVYVTTDGSDPAGRRGDARSGFAVNLEPGAIQWEPLLWDYVRCWQGVLPPQPEGTFVRYAIEGWRTYDRTYSCWCSEPPLDGTAVEVTGYGYWVDRFTTPLWAREAVLYQIFVDRFTGVENRWLTTTELNTFTGGTLRGIIDQLDYIVDLGVTTIWLSPVFVTPTYHGYDTSDYYQVDPRFGTNDDLRTLIDNAHRRGLRVILDFIANHTSVDFAPFAQAKSDPASPYRNWFTFRESYLHGYRTFFDVESMPQLDTDQPAVRNFLIEAACFWLREYGVDGFRLDYAAGPSHAFWSEFRAACKAANPECWLFGEVTLAGDELRTYQGRLDGCLDFAFCRAVRQLCAKPQPAISLAHFANTIARSRTFFGSGEEADFLLPAFLDNHDMNRFLWTAGNDKTRLRLAAALLFAFGDAPVIYYGTEVGLSQPQGKGPWREEARHPMRWGDSQDKALLAEFKQLIALRRNHPALVYGELQTHYLNDRDQLWLAERATGDDAVLIAVNLSDEARTLSLPWEGATDLSGAAVSPVVTIPATAVAFFTKR